MDKNTLSISDIAVDTWVQGGPITASACEKKVVLVEVFQVNCPGCFLYALPEAIRLYKKYSDKGLVVFGIATAFEDYDKNTLANLQLLAEKAEVIGETRHILQQQQQLHYGALHWRIPFALAMDKVTSVPPSTEDENVLDYASKHVAGFGSLIEADQARVLQQVRNYLSKQSKQAETFERFALRGTPSSILFDRSGQLVDISFGQQDHLQQLIESCL